MKTLKRLKALIVIGIVTLALVGWYPSEKKLTLSDEHHTIVLLKFKAQPDKGAYAVSEFNKLLENVKEEPNFVSIKLHVDPKDDTNILLYEEWEDKNYYNTEHMNTAHLKDFMANSGNFLIGPPEITFWEVKQIFD